MHRKITAATGKMNQILGPFRPIQQTKSRRRNNFLRALLPSQLGFAAKLFAKSDLSPDARARMHSCSPERLFSSGAITVDSFPLKLRFSAHRLCTSRPASSYPVPVLTAEPYFFRLHTNRVFIRRNATTSLVSVDLSKFSAEEKYLRRIINP
jgi:hypothetical protein